MKLIFCKGCQDVFKLDTEPRTCKCGATSGRYLDDLQAEYKGLWAVPIGFLNSSLARAVKNQPESGMGEPFMAFTIPKECDTMVKKE